MGFFDIYADVLEKAGGVLETVGPYMGPNGGQLAEAGSAMSSLASTIDAFQQEGVDGLWNAASQVAEGASAIEFFLAKSKAGGTTIISAGLKAIQGMQASCGGSEAPERGEGYSKSAHRFNGIADTLEKAEPSQWIGTASDAYAETNTRQRKRARFIPDVDLDMVMAITNQANQVLTTRQILNDSATVMGNCIAPAIALRAFGKYGKMYSLSLETSVTGSCVAGCLTHMNNLSNTSKQAAESMKRAAHLYHEIARACNSDRA